MQRLPSRKGKINCVHCGKLFHPYRQGDIRLCKVCIKAVRLHFWKGTKFHGPYHPNIDALSYREIAVLLTCTRISTGRCDELEEHWKELEDNAKKRFSDQMLRRTYAREGKSILKSSRKSLRTVMQKDLAKAMGWSRPTLDAIIEPMFEYKVLLRISRIGIVPNIPLIVERMTGQPMKDVDRFYHDLEQL